MKWLKKVFPAERHQTDTQNSSQVAIESYRWLDSRTVEIEVRCNQRFPAGEPLTTATVKRAFDEMSRWGAPGGRQNTL